MSKTIHDAPADPEHGNPDDLRALPPKFEGVPKALKELPRWIVWIKGAPKKDGSGRYDKIPMNAKTGKACNAHATANHFTFDEVCEAYKTGNFDGIAVDLPNEREPVAFDEQGGPLYLIGGDIDGCVALTADGKYEIAAYAQEALMRLGRPYFEVSPSGTGLRFFVLYAEPIKGGNKNGRELYSGGRFLTITGRGRGKIRAVGRELAALEHEWFGERKTANALVSDDGSDKLKSGIVTASLEETQENLALIESALSAVAANCDYERWRDIGFALHSLEWTRGFDLFDGWSQSAPRQYDRGAVEKLWNSTRNAGITVGTLFHYAKQNGWTDPRHAVNSTKQPTPDIAQTLNDTSNAERFVRACGERLRYVVELRIWLIWHEGHWRYDRKGQIVELAKRVATRMFADAGELATAADRNALFKWANASLQLPRLEAMVKLAQAPLAVSVSELDADPWLLGVKNGVVELRTGTFRQSRPEDLITKIANVEYVAGATCPTWEAMLDGCMGRNRQLADFIQRAAGYTLTGSTSEQVFFFAYGVGANGKSTVINALREIMGGHGLQSQPEVIMAQRNTNPSGPTPELARLAGVRMVAMVETEDGQRLHESRVKQMSGGDAMTARVLHGEPFDFVPKFKLWLAGNHRPVIRGDDHGIWRRIVLIPFLVTIPPEKRDRMLAEKLRDEYAGVLNWLIRGCLEWQRVGLDLPSDVVREVDQYKSDMDLIAQWLDEQCSVGPAMRCRARSAYQDYSTWAKDGGHQVITEVRFAQKLDERGFTKRKERQGMIYLGLTPRQGSLV